MKNWFKQLAIALAGATIFVSTLAHAVPLGPRQNRTVVMRVTDSPGGGIIAFINSYIQLREQGGRVVIAGECHSACTLAMALLPRDRVCATPTARIGFHTATETRGSFVAVHSVVGTAYVWALYPERIRVSLRLNGWNGDDPTQPHPDLIVYEGKMLGEIIDICPVSDWNPPTS